MHITYEVCVCVSLRVCAFLLCSVQLQGNYEQIWAKLENIFENYTETILAYVYYISTSTIWIYVDQHGRQKGNVSPEVCKLLNFVSLCIVHAYNIFIHITYMWYIDNNFSWSSNVCMRRCTCVCIMLTYNIFSRNFYNDGNLSCDLWLCKH